MLNFRFGSLQILAFLEALSFDHGSLMVPLLRLARFSECHARFLESHMLGCVR